MSFTPKNFNMEDYLFTVESVFVDTSSGEVISKSHFHKPLSVLDDEDINRYLHSFIRGIRQGKSIALSLCIARDRDLPKITEASLF